MKIESAEQKTVFRDHQRGVTTIDCRHTKQQFTITVNVDTARNQSPYSDSYVLPDFDKRDYRIMIGFGCPEREILATIAHELGHILGIEFNLPGAAQDPRFIQGDVTPEMIERQGEHIVASEDEAWTLAEQMLQLHIRYVNTYKQGYGVK